MASLTVMHSAMSRLFVGSLLSIAACRQSVPSAPSESRVAWTDQVLVELIAAEQSRGPDKGLWIGIHFQLAKGWHIYWQNPGDSGSAPTVAWTVAPNIAVAPIRWPTPARLPLGPLVSYGYEGEVVLPAKVLAGASHPALTIGANLHWVVCAKVCVPGRARLEMSIPASGSSAALPSAWRSLIAAAWSHMPAPMPAAWRAHAESVADAFTLFVTMDGLATHSVFFPLDESQIEDGAPQVVEALGRELRIHLKQSSQLTRVPPRLRGVLVFDSTASFTIDAPITPKRRVPRRP